MKRLVTALVVAGLFVVTGTQGLSAQEKQATPTIVRLSGVLRTPSGDPRSGTVVLVASIFAEQADVTPLWTEAQTLVLDLTGRYTLQVGSTVEGGIPKALFLDRSGKWIGVTVQGETDDVAARTTLVSVVYADKAIDADTLGGIPASSFVLSNKKSSSNPIGNFAGVNYIPKSSDGAGAYVNSTMYETGNKIGILTTTPLAALDVNGTIRANGSVVFSNGAYGLRSNAGVLTFDGGDVYPTAFNFQFGGGSTSGFYISSAGNIGINTTAPAYKLDVQHGGTTGVRIASSSGYSVLDIDAINGDAALRFYKAGVSKWLFRNRPADDYLELFELGGGGSRLVVQRSTGNVGIGETTSPAYKLDVLHGGGLGVHVKSSASYSVVDIDAFNGDAALRFQKNGVDEWLIRNDPATDNLQFYEQGSGERLRIDNATGKVWVNGAFTVLGVKAFTMDHPLDPENKLLMHAAAESNEVINFYSGNTTTDGSGLATVALPDYFEAINKDFRYQLTVIGTFAQAIVNKEVRNNTFEIATSQPNVKVSWEVKGVRNDARMQKFPFVAEEDKTPSMRGTFVDPEVHNVPRAGSASGKPASSVDAQGRAVAVAPNPLNTSGGSVGPGPIIKR